MPYEGMIFLEKRNQLGRLQRGRNGEDAFRCALYTQTQNTHTHTSRRYIQDGSKVFKSFESQKVILKNVITFIPRFLKARKVRPVIILLDGLAVVLQ